jgi:TFIIF-interacting CTD phosphatase-like protein
MERLEDKNKDYFVRISEPKEGLIFKDLKMEDGLGVKLHLRPGLQEYLRELTEVADVFAFTAGLPVYARPIIKCLDPEQKIFKKVWYRDSCTYKRFDFESGGFTDFHTKDLETMKHYYDPNRTILVDNEIYSFLPQPSNGILIRDWVDNPKDDHLSEVLKVVKELQTESDVKPALHDMFNLTAKVDQFVNKYKYK